MHPRLAETMSYVAHPLLGELDLYQWLIFVGQHEGRHKKQIERTLKSIPE